MTSVRVFRSYLKTPFLILLTVEVCLIFFSVYISAYLRYINSPNEFLNLADNLWIQASILAVITPIVMLATGLYQGHIREGMAGILLRLLISLMAASLIVALLFYMFPILFLGRGIMLLAGLLSFFVIGTLRAIFFELVDSETFKKRVLVYGAGKTAKQIDSRLRRKSDRRSFSIFGYILLEHQKQLQEVDDNKLVKPTGSLLDYAQLNDIDEIVVATSDIRAEIPVDELVECKINGIEVVDILSFFEREVGQIRVDILDPRWLVFSEGFRQSQLNEHIKRLFDLLSSFILLTVASPFMVLTILAIKIEEGLKAPVFYHQVRVGKDGREFKVFKFRSMRTDAETPGKAVWATKTDSRVTKVGSFIRKTRIDELPQIYNALNGSMSFVGPRPERPEFVETLAKEIPYYHDRHLVKPGITGWAQLMYPYGASVNDAYQKQLYDLYYIKNKSVFLDFLILLQTVEIVLFGKGAR
jgi:sugar transferase (PEP-CTERM system associated)